MATLTQLKTLIDTQYAGKVLDLTCQVHGVVSKIRYTDLATDADKAAIEALIDGFNWSAPDENLELFFELFAKDAVSGVFTPEQWTTMKMLSDIKSDVQFRYQILLQVAAAGTDAQRLRLAQIAAQSGVALPAIS